MMHLRRSIWLTDHNIFLTVWGMLGNPSHCRLSLLLQHRCSYSLEMQLMIDTG